jgi:regulator of protease activity HflC (stomatin/prohibitin superfamily)
MFDSPIIAIILIVLLMIFLFTRLKIAQENERFAVHVLGQYKGMKGPGLLIKWTGSETKWSKVKADDRGKAVTHDMVRILDVDIPYQSVEKVKIGDYLRISGFDGEKVIVVMDPDQRGSFVCKKCGHHNILN